MDSTASELSDRDLNEALYWLRIEATEDNEEQLRVFAEAMSIYQEREAARGGLWKEAGARDSAHHLKSKASRVKTAAFATNPEAGLDDALDAVNYAAFYVRNVRAERLEDHT